MCVCVWFVLAELQKENPPLEVAIFSFRFKSLIIFGVPNTNADRGDRIERQTRQIDRQWDRQM